MHYLHNTQYKYRPTRIYDLDVIISVGYRVKSKRGTAFRIWARRILKDYLVKGYAVSDRIRKEQIGELRQLVGITPSATAISALPPRCSYGFSTTTASSTVKTAPNVSPTTPLWL